MIYIKYKECKTHPKLQIGGGTLSGGKGWLDILSADTVILLDKSTLPNTVIDSKGELSSPSQRVIFFPIDDMDVPEDLESFSNLLEIIRDDLECGKSVHVQCIGGHGRTGTVIACLMGKYYEIRNPIKWVRKNYCSSAIESYKQVEFVSKFTGTKKFCTIQNWVIHDPTIIEDSNKVSTKYDEWWEQLLIKTKEVTVC